MPHGSGDPPGTGARAATTRSGPGLFGALDRLVHWVARLADELATVIFMVLIIVVVAAVVAYKMGISIAWLDDVLRMSLIWMVYLGVVPLGMSNDHITMDAVYARLPTMARRVMNLIFAALGISLSLYTARVGYVSLETSLRYQELLPSGYVPSWPLYLVIPLGFTLMAVSYVLFALKVLRGQEDRPASEAERIAAAYQESGGPDSA